MMKIADTSTPVVILKLEHYGALGIVRSLGRFGISVYGVDGNDHAPAFSSRYCQRKFIWDVDKEQAWSTVQYLLSVGQRIGQQAILIATSDETAALVAENAATLKEWFIFPCVSANLVHSLCSKKEMFFLAKRLGMPTAETHFPQSKQDVLQYLERVSFPVMLKGIDGGRLEKRTGKKMVNVRNERELLESYEWMEDPDQPNLMLQEYLPGGDDSVWMFNGYFNEQSECLIGFTGKKIRQNPVYTGMTSLGICLRNLVIEETTKRFMKIIGYRGILDIGYRYDARDGIYKLLDVNPRIGATFRLFVGVRGMDVARALYLDLTGQPVPQDTLREGRKWIVEDKDIRSCYQYFRDGELKVGEWLRSFRGIEEAGYFALSDQRPFWRMWWNHCARKFSKFLNRRKQDIDVREHKHKVQAFFNRSEDWQGKIYAQQNDRFTRAVARRKEYAFQLLDKVGGLDGKITLDIGCGGGTYLEHPSLGAAKTYGLDFSMGMLQAARKRLDHRAKLLNGDVEEIPLRDVSVDLILCIGVLGYLLSDRKAILEMHRVLRPEGFLLISVENMMSLSNIDYVLRQKLASMLGSSRKIFDSGVSMVCPWVLANPAKGYRYRLYHPWKLDEMMKNFGFTPIDTMTMGHEFRILRKFKIVSESVLGKAEVALERFFRRYQLPYLSYSGESYTALYQK